MARELRSMMKKTGSSTRRVRSVKKEDVPAKRLDGPTTGEALRRQAEARLRVATRDVSAMSSEDVQRLVQELQVHQVELEMQNEELRQTQVKLEATRDRFAALYIEAPTGYLTLDSTGVILAANRLACTVLGGTQRELVGAAAIQFVAAADQARFVGHLRQVLSSRCPQVCDVQLARQAGTQVRCESVAVLDEASQSFRVQTVVLNIAAIKHLELELRESEARFRVMADTIPVMIWMSGADKLYTYFNANWLLYTGRTLEQEIGNGWRRGVHPEDADRCLKTYLEAFDQRKAFTMEYRLRHADGQYGLVLDDAVPHWLSSGEFVGYVGSCTDITERKQSEARQMELQHQISQAQKMGALGLLAGGVAHDFNNILSAILGTAEMARAALAADHPVQDCLTVILDASDRASQLIDQILTFTHQQEAVQVVLPLAPVVREVFTLLRATLPAGIELTCTDDAATPHVRIDPTQIHQVVMNLCTNAWHALGDRPGSIAVALSPVMLTQPLVGIRTTLPAGFYARLSIRDTGCGIEPDMVARMFTPFFTTKSVGQGTGLGLSVVHDIVDRLRGALVVESQLGQGTTVHVYLPAVEAEPVQADQADQADATLVQGHGRHVLYLDDEAVLVKVVKTQLEAQGYRVTGCTNAADALEAIRADPARFDVVVTDYNMPEMSGLEVAHTLARLGTDLPVMLVSGYLSPTVQANALTAGIREIVRKPFKIQQITSAIARLFDSPGQG